MVRSTEEAPFAVRPSHVMDGSAVEDMRADLALLMRLHVPRLSPATVLIPPAMLTGRDPADDRSAERATAGEQLQRLAPSNRY
jgi:hypothetical protein